MSATTTSPAGAPARAASAATRFVESVRARVSSVNGEPEGKETVTPA